MEKAFPALNLPAAPLHVKIGQAGRQVVFDPLRRRFVTLTAEEWVRQHFVHFLVAERGFPPSLMANEVGVNVSGVTRRCDSVLFARADASPRVIIEYKAPHIGITEAVFRQVESYNSILHADYLIVSNGLRHFCCHFDYNKGRTQFLPDIPHYHQLAPR